MPTATSTAPQTWPSLPRGRGGTTTLAGMAAATLLAAATLSAGCTGPTPPRYELPPVTAEATAAELPAVALDADLAALPPSQVGAFTQGPVTGRVAFDGRRAVFEVSGLPAPAAACPTVLYFSEGGGAQRWEHRFRGDKVTVSINGEPFGGKAPRARYADGSYRVAVPTLPGDFAVLVQAPAAAAAGNAAKEPCSLKRALPVVTGDLVADGGVRWAQTETPTVVAVRAGGGDDAQDHRRFEPGAELVLLGAHLDRVEEVLFEDVQATPTTRLDERLVVRAAGDGDTDTVTMRAGQWRSPPLWAPVEGTVHRIGDAMATLSNAIWSTWLVVLLVGAGLILTIVNGFPQFRGFRHALDVVRGHYDDPNEQGEITHFQALTAALSATVGLGNIAGVAVAVTNGGPGAVFWMWICGFLGMATKFSECTLSTCYRDVREDGTVAGGPMYYMRKQLGWLAPMGTLYAVLITFASFGGGNMFQSNQTAALWREAFGVPPWVTGLILVALVGLVILGGIKRIGRVTDKLVPSMAAIYIVGALAVIFTHVDRVGPIFTSIFTEAFSVSAAVGGVLGLVVKDVLIQGFRRAAFSNEAGFGSAAIAHAAVRTDEPVREGVVALLEPFIDTIVICTMTALVILISGAWTQQGLDGVNLTAVSFDSVFQGFGSVLVPIAVFLFAVSTMISWSYYGEKGVEFLFGRRAVTPYRVAFIGALFIGSVWKLGPVLDFSDAMLGMLVVPNILAILLLLPKLRGLVGDYFGRLRSGQMVRYK